LAEQQSLDPIDVLNPLVCQRLALTAESAAVLVLWRRRPDHGADPRFTAFVRQQSAHQGFAVDLVGFSAPPTPRGRKPGASSRDPRGLQTETLGRAGRMARPRGLATDGLSACLAIRRPRVVTMTKPAIALPVAYEVPRHRRNLPDQLGITQRICRALGIDDEDTRLRAKPQRLAGVMVGQGPGEAG
jgi:hypothetical protein